MVVARVPMVSFVELKWARMSKVAEALIVEPMGLWGVRVYDYKK